MEIEKETNNLIYKVDENYNLIEYIQNEKIYNNEYMKKLLKIITKENIFNEDKSKILLLEDYEFLIEIFCLLNDQEIICFINYLNRINISFLKILINGFIDFDCNKKEEIILDIISKVITDYFNKNIFYFIYGKLSYLYRKHEHNMNTIKQFEKLFNVWKLLYNLNKIPLNNHNEEISTISFFHKHSNNLNIEINFINKKALFDSFLVFNEDEVHKIKDKKDIRFYISIHFISSIILNLNKYIDNFIFLKLYDNMKNNMEIKFNDIFVDKYSDINSFYKIQKIKFELIDSTSTIYFNDSEKIQKNYNFKFNQISKMEILNNFLGEVSSIIIEKEEIDSNNKEHIIKNNLKLEIAKNINNKIECNIFLNGEHNKKNNELIKYSGEIFSDNYLDYNRDKDWKKSKLNLKNISYFGGLGSIIPLFRLINNIIIYFGELIEKSQINKNDINNYKNKVFMWIKDIMRIIIQMICISQKNYNNFKKIIIELIGSLAEILNALLSSKVMSNDDILLFFNNEVFHILYLIILNSQIPNIIKKTFKELFKINISKISNIDTIILNINKNMDLDWYFIFLYNFILFMIAYFNSVKYIPKVLIDQINNIYNYIEEKLKKEENENELFVMKSFIDFLKEIYIDEENKDFTKDIISKCHDFKKENKYYIKFILNMLTTFLNFEIAKRNIENKSIVNNDNPFFLHLQKLLLSIISDGSFQKQIFSYYHLIIDNFKYYTEQFNFLSGLFIFLKKEEFISKQDLIMEELIDYHGKYHHLMKELFIFNRLWSDQSLFYKTSLEDIKKTKLKYKNINYYTRNYQRPIIYPVLDYKYRYPDFSSFKIDKDLYNREEMDDIYNFDLFCPELDNYNNKYYKEFIEKIRRNEEMNINLFEDVCLVKQKYHIKGNLFFVFNNKPKFNKIIFFSHSYCFQNNNPCNKEINNENKEIKNSKNNLCFGSIFKCHEKESNRKIRIDFENIRLILKRIYYYRNSAIEFFTETKSYYFNFLNNKQLEELFSIFINLSENLYFPIINNKNIIGLIKINHKINTNLDYFKLIDEKKINFIEYFLSKSSNIKLCEISIFDILLLINLISNRSFIDLNQYPIFPLLYFYDTKINKLIDRNFNEHIGFQDSTDSAKIRKKQFIDIYLNSTINSQINNKNPHFFSTHYSNCIFTSNYLIRLLPYSVISIELQGDGFDNPNRLFYSIENTFNNIIQQRSDLRELIPEFFYLPEMFMNINSYNFHEKADNNPVDDVEITEKIITNFRNNINKDNENNNIQIKILKNINYSENYFLFVESMKNKLEYLRDNISNWINNIFGTNQRTNKKNQQYFRDESYINNEKEYQIYKKDNIIMTSVEFGLIPLQTIFDNKILSNLKKSKSDDIDKYIKEIKNNSLELRKKAKSFVVKIIENKLNNSNFKKNEINENNVKNKYKEYWEEPLNITLKINNDNEIGILEINKNDITIHKIMDHNDKILDFYYNKRLNMFATTSLDGFICIYILPKKLICMIKNPYNSYFEKIFLSANPFPNIIAFDKKENILNSYSLSGILINSIKIKVENDSLSKIIPLFNIYGKTFKDKLKLVSENGDHITINVPFLYKEKEETSSDKHIKNIFNKNNH